MFCKFCGTEIPDGAPVCPKCGQQTGTVNNDSNINRPSDNGYNCNPTGNNGAYNPYNQYGNQPPYNQNPGYNGGYNNPNPYNNQPQYSYNPNGYNQYQQNEYYAKANVGLCILSVIFPIAGIILYAVYKNTRPHAAKVYLWWGIGSFIVEFILSFISRMAGLSTYNYSNSSVETTRYYYSMISGFLQNIL